MTSVDNNQIVFYIGTTKYIVNTRPYFWACIEVLRLPRIHSQEKSISWMFDPLFRERKIYGLKLQLTPKFSWKFLLLAGESSKDPKEALMDGIKFRDSLRARFPGIVTKISVRPTLPYFDKENKRFWEIKIPSRGYFYSGKINLFQKLINFAWLHNTRKKINVYIFWQREPRHKNYPRFIEPASFEERLDLKLIPKRRKHYLQFYKMRLLIEVDLDLDDELNINEEDLELYGQLNSLAIGILSSEGYGAAFTSTDETTWIHILINEVFEENHITFIKPQEFDFEFLESIPLKKSLWLEDENIKLEPYDKNDPNIIDLGFLFFKGELTTHKKPFRIDYLLQRALISGNNGVGKSFFVFNLLTQIYKKLNDIGFIYINTVKSDQVQFFQMGNNIDLIIEWNSPECHVPYYTKESNIYDSAKYIIAQLGLKNFFESDLVRVFHSFVEHLGEPPKSIKILLENLVEYIKSDEDLDSKTKARRISYLKEQIDKITKEKYVVKNLEANEEIPHWFRCLMMGGGIFLDLSPCKNREAQRLFLCAMFNYLRTKLPQTNKLKVILALDEAHRLFQEQTGHHVHDDDFISFKGFQDLAAELIEETRSQGISFIFIDQDPKLLMSKVRSAPMVHFTFSSDMDNAKILAHNKEEEELISNLGNREVLCRNKIKKEKFLLYTNDFSIRKIKNPNMRLR